MQIKAVVLFLTATLLGSASAFCSKDDCCFKDNVARDKHVSSILPLRTSLCLITNASCVERRCILLPERHARRTLPCRLLYS
ncbi:hypothetical protein BDP67DRAFT_294316 [Colletotrichum lupini]|nr:hypothetical protein BDP67DRAFT_294316 [Colletotrichum lupini]